MKKIVLMLIMVLSIGFINVSAFEPISVPTCGVTVKTNYDNGDTYKIKIEKITENAPMPSVTEVTLKAGEEKTFGAVTHNDEGNYEYKVTLDGNDDDYFVYTVSVIRDYGVLKYQTFVKEKGEGEKLSKVLFTVVNEKPDDPTPVPSDDTTPSKPVNHNTNNRGIINPYTADLIFKFLGILIISGVVIFITVKQINKNKKA